MDPNLISRKLVNKFQLFFRRLTSFNRVLPNFMIIGVQKGGTTSLFHYLKSHPKIKQSYFKETHYFDEHFERPLSWYKAFFPFSKQNGIMIGEATPSYLFFDEVPKRIYSLIPECKFIVLLRNPIDRAVSHYEMNISRRDETADSFEKAIGMHGCGIPQGGKQMNKKKFYSYLERGLYANQISNWLMYFQRKQFLFIKSEHLLTNPEHEMEKIYDFLGLEKEYPKTFTNRNLSRAKRTELTQPSIDFLSNYYANDDRALGKLIGYEYRYFSGTPEG